VCNEGCPSGSLRSSSKKSRSAVIRSQAQREAVACQQQSSCPKKRFCSVAQEQPNGSRGHAPKPHCSTYSICNRSGSDTRAPMVALGPKESTSNGVFSHFSTLAPEVCNRSITGSPPVSMRHQVYHVNHHLGCLMPALPLPDVPQALQAAGR
jgi:hypothetical protein